MNWEAANAKSSAHNLSYRTSHFSQKGWRIEARVVFNVHCIPHPHGLRKWIDRPVGSTLSSLR